MKGTSGCLRRLSSLPGQAAAAAAEAQRTAARAAYGQARVIVPVRTGALKASLSVRQDDKGARLAAERPYAGYVERKKPYLLPAAQSAGYPGLAARVWKEKLP